jgi:hypothetical protein
VKLCECPCQCWILNFKYRPDGEPPYESMALKVAFRRKIRAKMGIYGPWGFWTICSLFPTADLQ